MADTVLQVLASVLHGIERLSVAVSGGVDSLTLATLVHCERGSAAQMFHAVSPAVPEEATARTRDLAARNGWALSVIDAGEFADPDYRRNPANRCFYCKQNLYAAIAARSDATIVSGTNLDDLGEYRPGLEAARAHSVRHPYVEAGIGKRVVRKIAAQLGLGGIADLPAAPCLASRIETGIRIEAPMLALVHSAERLVAEELGSPGPEAAVRCRVRAGAVIIELGQTEFERLDPGRERRLRAGLASLLAGAGLSKPIAFAAYRAGSAFLHEQAKRDG